MERKRPYGRCEGGQLRNDGGLGRCGGGGGQTQVYDTLSIYLMVLTIDWKLGTQESEESRVTPRF